MTATPRSLVIHHDDLGSSHAANFAFEELSDLGIVTSGSVMVPCPWFPEIAATARRRPDLDLGVHLTLTAEYPGYRWRPLTGVSRTGLTDAEGCFPRTVAEVRNADPAAVEAELRLQVDMALDQGIDATHLDAHMGAAWQPEFLDIYVRLGAAYRLPIVLSADVAKYAPAGTDFAPSFATLLERENPIFQRFLLTPFGNLAPGADTYRTIFDSAAAGLNYAAFHFTAPGDFAFASPDAPTRTAEYELFRAGTASRLLDELGITRIGMRSFRDAMRGTA